MWINNAWTWSVYLIMEAELEFYLQTQVHDLMNNGWTVVALYCRYMCYFYFARLSYFLLACNLWYNWLILWTKCLTHANCTLYSDSNKTKKDAGCLNLCHSQNHCFYFVPDTICLGKPVTKHNTAGTPDPKRGYTRPKTRVHQTRKSGYTRPEKAGTPDP